jgi:hypothetical protein
MPVRAPFGTCSAFALPPIGGNIPACLGDHVEHVDADCFHGRPGEDGKAAFLAFHGLTDFKLSTKGVAAGAGCKSEGEVMAVIENLMMIPDRNIIRNSAEALNILSGKTVEIEPKKGKSSSQITEVSGV